MSRNGCTYWKLVVRGQMFWVPRRLGEKHAYKPPRNGPTQGGQAQSEVEDVG